MLSCVEDVEAKRRRQGEASAYDQRLLFERGLSWDLADRAVQCPDDNLVKLSAADRAVLR